MIANWFKKKKPIRTVVYLRSMATPVQHWEAQVYYDAWGTPYVPGSLVSGRAMYGNIVLYQNGRTDSVWDVFWKHKSGPEITFGSPPKNPFDRNP